MKNLLPTVFTLCFIVSQLQAQQITSLSINKPIEENSEHNMTITLFVPMEDLQGFDVNNPVDFKKSEITLVQDDTGKDLLAEHVEVMSRKSYQNPILDFYGVHDYSNNKDLDINLDIKSSPAKGAQSVKVEGKVVLNFAGSGEEKEIIVSDVPLRLPYDSPGFETPVGMIKLQQAGSIGFDDVTYELFRVLATDIALVTAKAADGPSSEAMQELIKLDVGIEGFEIPFKGDLPETVNLKIVYGEIETREVPLDFEVSLGF